MASLDGTPPFWRPRSSVARVENIIHHPHPTKTPTPPPTPTSPTWKTRGLISTPTPKTTGPIFTPTPKKTTIPITTPKTTIPITTPKTPTTTPTTTVGSTRNSPFVEPQHLTGKFGTPSIAPVWSAKPEVPLPLLACGNLGIGSIASAPRQLTRSASSSALATTSAPALLSSTLSSSSSLSLSVSPVFVPLPLGAGFFLGAASVPPFVLAPPQIQIQKKESAKKKDEGENKSDTYVHQFCDLVMRQLVPLKRGIAHLAVGEIYVFAFETGETLVPMERDEALFLVAQAKVRKLLKSKAAEKIVMEAQLQMHNADVYSRLCAAIRLILANSDKSAGIIVDPSGTDVERKPFRIEYDHLLSTVQFGEVGRDKKIERWGWVTASDGPNFLKHLHQRLDRQLASFQSF